MTYCDSCEEYVVDEDGRCPNCYRLIIKKEFKSKQDEWTDDDEWGSEDWGEELSGELASSIEESEESEVDKDGLSGS